MPPDSPEPSITSWMRLEPHSRNAEMAGSLQANIYDPLWMLARQWQVGEFAGEDNGSPIVARWRADAARLTRFYAGAIAPNNEVSAPDYDPSRLPLETLVEREAVRPLGQPTARPEQLRLAAEGGQHFLRMLELQPISGDYRAAFISLFPLPAPTDEQRAAMDDASISFCELMAGRAPDGRQLYALFQPNGAGEIVIPAALQIAPGDLAEVEKAALLWLQWFQALISEPGAIPASWLPERLEYAFSVGTRLSDGERILTAQEYIGGRLDWYAFDQNPEVSIGGAADAAITPVTRTVIPAPASFRGMPAPRFWEFEDAQVDFGAVDAGPTDLLRMLLVEFSLVYGSDWFVIPIELDIGALYQTRSLVITDTFGVRILIKPGSESGPPHSLWRMFQLAHTRSSGIDVPASNQFFLPPALIKSVGSTPVEEVLFLRDEMANMAWAVERLVESATGAPLNRFEAYLERQRRDTPEAEPTPPKAQGALRYQLASQVPDYWVPLLPTRVGQGLRLRRGAHNRRHDGTCSRPRPHPRSWSVA